MVKKELVALKLIDIVPYERNPRYNDEAVADVKESIRQCENLDPIEVDEGNIILSGHTRLKAMLDKLKLSFNGRPIPFGEVRTEDGKPFKTDGVMAQLMAKRKPGDSKMADVSARERGKYSCFNNYILWDNKVANTIAANGTFCRGIDGHELSDEDYANVSSFPQDYDFGTEHPHYVCGMSVPPNMMANIATEIYKQWLEKE